MLPELVRHRTREVLNLVCVLYCSLFTAVVCSCKHPRCSGMKKLNGTTQQLCHTTLHVSSCSGEPHSSPAQRTSSGQRSSCITLLCLYRCTVVVLASTHGGGARIMRSVRPSSLIMILYCPCFSSSSGTHPHLRCSSVKNMKCRMAQFLCGTVSSGQKPLSRRAPTTQEHTCALHEVLEIVHKPRAFTGGAHDLHDRTFLRPRGRPRSVTIPLLFLL